VLNIIIIMESTAAVNVPLRLVPAEAVLAAPPPPQQPSALLLFICLLCSLYDFDSIPPIVKTFTYEERA
jgi:hypothetical protein